MSLVSVALVGTLLTLASRADVTTKNRTSFLTDQQLAWTQIKIEIEQAQEACEACITSISRRMHQQALSKEMISVTVRAGFSLRPSTSVLDFVVTREPSGRPKEVVTILDIRIERDFDAGTLKGSSFRIVRNSARDEGVEMLNNMVKFFEKKRWPYEVIDPNKKAKRDETSSKPKDNANKQAQP